MLRVATVASALPPIGREAKAHAATAVTQHRHGGGFLRQRDVGVNIEGATSFAGASEAVWESLSAAFSAVRFDATWQIVEPTTPGVYNWSLFDALVARCKAHGVMPYLILDYDNTLCVHHRCRFHPFAANDDADGWPPFQSCARVHGRLVASSKARPVGIAPCHEHHEL